MISVKVPTGHLPQGLALWHLKDPRGYRKIRPPGVKHTRGLIGGGQAEEVSKQEETEEDADHGLHSCLRFVSH